MSDVLAGTQSGKFERVFSMVHVYVRCTSRSICMTERMRLLADYLATQNTAPCLKQLATRCQDEEHPPYKGFLSRAKRPLAPGRGVVVCRAQF